MARILVIDAHPDPDPTRLVHALARAYADGACDAGHEVRVIALAEMEVPYVRSRTAWEAPPPPAIAEAQAALAAVGHVAILFPLWLGAPPALLKAFLEQVLRPGFAFGAGSAAHGFAPRLGGRSARVVVTMGMPAPVYRWWYGAHAVRALDRNVLRFVGFGPVRRTLIGAVDDLGAAGVARWQARLRALGAAMR